MPYASFDDTIDVAIALDAIVPTSEGFGIPLWITDDAVPGGTTRVMSFSTAAEVATALAATTITATCAAALTLAFSQDNAPDVIKVGFWNLTAGTEAIADAWTAITNFDNDFYGVCLESRTEANQVSFAALVAAADVKFAFLQTADADAYDGADTDDIGYQMKALDYDNVSCLYYGTNGTAADLATLSDRASFDLDVTAPPWFPVSLTGVTKSNLTTTQKSALEAKNYNMILNFGGSPKFGMGVTASGRDIAIVWTRDYLQVRLTEAWQRLLTTFADRGEKLALNTAGITAVRAEVEKVLNVGISAGHIDSYTVDFPQEYEVSDSDRLANRLTASFAAIATVGAKRFALNGTLSTTL